MAGGERGVEQMRADEARAAGDRQLHSGDQGPSSVSFGAPSSSAAVAEPLDDRLEQRLDALFERGGDRRRRGAPLAFSSAFTTFARFLSSSRSVLVSAIISGLSSSPAP